MLSRPPPALLSSSGLLSFRPDVIYRNLDGQPIVSCSRDVEKRNNAAMRMKTVLPLGELIDQAKALRKMLQEPDIRRGLGDDYFRLLNAVNRLAADAADAESSNPGIGPGFLASPTLLPRSERASG